MSAPDLSLLVRRRFAPIFVVQFLGAFNDNLLKFAMLFLANFALYAAEPAKAELLATVATGLFILPYFLFSSIAGQLADAHDKATCWSAGSRRRRSASWPVAGGGLLVQLDPAAARRAVRDGRAFDHLRAGQTTRSCRSIWATTRSWAAPG